MGIMCMQWILRKRLFSKIIVRAEEGAAAVAAETLNVGDGELYGLQLTAILALVADPSDATFTGLTGESSTTQEHNTSTSSASESEMEYLAQRVRYSESKVNEVLFFYELTTNSMSNPAPNTPTCCTHTDRESVIFSLQQQWLRSVGFTRHCPRSFHLFPGWQKTLS